MSSRVRERFLLRDQRGDDDVFDRRTFEFEQRRGDAEANEGNKKAFISRQDENEGIQRIPARTREPDRPHPSL